VNDRAYTSSARSVLIENTNQTARIVWNNLFFVVAAVLFKSSLCRSLLGRSFSCWALLCCLILNPLLSQAENRNRQERPLGPSFDLDESSQATQLAMQGGSSPQSGRRSAFSLSEFPKSYTIVNDRAVFQDSAGRSVYLTLNPKLQAEAERLLRAYKPDYGALVVMDPKSGAILAASGSSSFGLDGRTILGQATFPAASLFKVITASAAVERGMLSGSSVVRFRGGTHALSSANYFPEKRLDRKQMTLADALGKSCNPVFARVAMNNLQPYLLKSYAERFGFNSQLACDFPLQQSRFSIGPSDYEYARTAAGFEGAKINPVHAAVIASTVGNGGEVLRPFLIDEVRSPDGALLFDNNKAVLSRAIDEQTAYEVRSMMLETTRTGTARKHFRTSPLLHSVAVAGKTGTLKGDNPQGLYHWFIGVAPASNPKIAISALAIDGGRRTVGASSLAAKLLENFFRSESGLPLKQFKSGNSEPSPVKLAKASKKRVYSYRSISSKKASKKASRSRRT